MDRLASDYCLQFFCGLSIKPGDKLPSFKIISEIRSELGMRMNYEAFQQKLADHWLPHLDQPNRFKTDATCYETHMRYPTDIKLLWECCEWVYDLLVAICKVTHRPLPRNKFREQEHKQKAFNYCKKPSFQVKRRRIKALLNLLHKMLPQLKASAQSLEISDKDQFKLWVKYHGKIGTVTKVVEQQQDFFDTRQYPKDRIVSLDKDYIRPIIRGKENKRVEFGAKANLHQIDKINFVEYFSFDAFHEGNRLPNNIGFHFQLTGKKVNELAGDKIYATNSNRKLCSTLKITTSFIPKGRKGSNEEEKRKKRIALAKERATHTEGSFGVEKEHYGLKRIRARNASTEKLWIFFGIHTANAKVMVTKIAPLQHQTQQAA